MHNLVQEISKKDVIRRRSDWITSLDGISLCTSGHNHSPYPFAHLFYALISTSPKINRDCLLNKFASFN